MDFKLSYNWLKEFVGVRVSPEELAERLSLHSVSVERVRRLDEGLDRIAVGLVERIEAHPNADKLRTALVRTGKGDPARVVCGGSNIREGQLVAYAMPGARVRWHGQGDLVELKPTEIRGVRSEGMICAASEIGLGEWFAEGEREILDCSFLPASVMGKSLAVALDLDDAVLDCEITTNRPDLMSVMGLAREVAAVTGATLKNKKSSVFRIPHAPLPIRVRIEDPRICPRYGAVRMDGVCVAPSPWSVQRRILISGLRPVNNIVDATNIVMLETGQPTHAFDASQIRDGQIVVRRARPGERIVTLDHVDRALAAEDLVIADAERPIAIAGVIGGQESGITDATTSVVLEVANFDPVSVRRSARRLNVRTDAAIRFEKGLQSESVDAVLPRAVDLLIGGAGGDAGKPVVVGRRPAPMRPIPFDATRAIAGIGTAIPLSRVRQSLTALGCRVSGAGARWRVTPPWWRRGDLTAMHDLTEEVARLYGYHRLPSALPSGALPASARPPEPPTTAFGWEDWCRDALTGMGATEVMAYALTPRETIERCGFTAAQCVTLENPLSEEFALLRPSLIPTLLPIVRQNQEHTPKAAVFEMGNVYIPANLKSSRGRDAGLPREEMRLLVASYGRMVSGGHVLQLKGVVEQLFERLGIVDVAFRRSESCVLPSGVCLWHPGRTMDVIVGDALVGALGEVHPEIVGRFGVEQRVAVAELDWNAILPRCRATRPAPPPSEFPPVKRDLAFVVDRMTPYAEIAAVLATFDPMLTDFELFDTYEDPTGTSVPAGKKSVAFHLTWSAPDRTLTAVEVDRVLERLTEKLRERFGAEVRE